MLEALQQALVHKGVKEIHLLGAALQDGADHILNHVLGHVHVSGQVTEGHLRLDHPKLRGVALGVGVFRPEGGAEGVDVAEGHGKVLRVELAGHGEAGGLAEEILAVINLAVLQPRGVFRVQGGHPEHLAGAFAVRGGDDGGVHVDKAPVLEELVNGEGRHRPDPEGCGEEVGPGAQVGHRP